MSDFRSQSWSIHRRVLGWVIAAMILVFGANLISGYFVNKAAVDSAYDRVLLASATAIAENTRLQNAQIIADIPYAALDMLASTAQDRVYYSVFAPDGTAITGYDDLPMPVELTDQQAASEPYFYDAFYKGVAIRVVLLRSFISGRNLSGFVSIRVAQSRGERTDLTYHLLQLSSLWSLVIAIVGSAAAWLGITFALRPLERLREKLGRRSANDIRPIIDNVPKEFTPLVDAINAMLQRLENGFRAMRQFISDASHQLKTPLAGLQVQTQMALREDDAEILRESLSKIDTSIRRTSRLAQQLLSHARAAEPGGEFKPVNLAAIARDTITQLTPQALAKEIDLGYEGPDRIEICGDPTLLGEMMSNLIDNALQYPPSGAKVTLALHNCGNVTSLIVDDTGPGIPVELRRDVLRRFFRIPGNHEEGCGLGLAIVQEIAHRHQSEVMLEDAPEGGLRVRIDFVSQQIAGE